MSNFHHLELWEKSRALVRDLYRETASFPKIEVFCLVQQMRRAAVSIVCNLAEAHGRRSNPDRIHFLTIARGSLLELEAQTIVATDLEYLSPNNSEVLLAKIAEVTRLMNGLIRHYARLHRQPPTAQPPTQT
jgi:four helix bundle protein